MAIDGKACGLEIDWMIPVITTVGFLQDVIHMVFTKGVVILHQSCWYLSIRLQHVNCLQHIFLDFLSALMYPINLVLKNPATRKVYDTINLDGVNKIFE